MPAPQLSLAVEYIDGGSAVVDAYVAELIQFERQYDKPMSSLFGDGRRVEYLLFVAWAAAKRAGETREFDDWLTQVATVELVTQGEDDPVPLDPTPPTAS